MAFRLRDTPSNAQTCHDAVVRHPKTWSNLSGRSDPLKQYEQIALSRSFLDKNDQDQGMHVVFGYLLLCATILFCRAHLC